jgi:hypothetical protein
MLSDHVFHLFCTPEIVEVIARETNWYAQKFLENTPNLKLRSRTHHWKEMNRSEIMMVFQMNALDIFQEHHWYIRHIYLITAFGFPIFQALEGSKGTLKKEACLMQASLVSMPITAPHFNV